MHVVRRRDINRIEPSAFFIQQIAPILINPCSWKLLPYLCGATEVDVSDGHQLERLELGELSDVSPGHTASAEAGVLQCAVWGLAGPPAGDKWRGQGGSAQCFEEGT